MLLSGGLDSATVLAIARAEGYETYALSVSYGQRHVAELNAAVRVASCGARVWGGTLTGGSNGLRRCSRGGQHARGSHRV